MAVGAGGRAPSEGGASLPCGHVTRGGAAGKGQKRTEEGSSLWLQGFGVLRWDRNPAETRNQVYRQNPGVSWLNSQSFKGATIILWGR